MVLLCAILAVFNIETAVFGQDAITLVDCKQKALEHDQTIKQKEANLKSNEASVKLSNRASLPTFDLSSSYYYQNDPMKMEMPGYELPTITGTSSGVYSPGGVTQMGYKNNYNANIEMGLPLYLGGKLAQSKKIARHGLSIAQSDLALTKTQILFNIEQQYWTLVSLLEQQKVVDQSVMFLTDMVEDMNNFYTTGVVTKNEVLKAQVELNDAKLGLINIGDNIVLVKMQLNQLMGLDIDNPLSIADTLIEVIIDERLLDYNPDNLYNRQEISILNRQLDINQSEESITRADFRPEIVSFANYTFQNPNHLVQDEGEFTWSGGISLSIPVFHWGERKLNITQTKMKEESTVQNISHTKDLIQLEMQQSIFNLSQSLKKLEFTREALKQAEENLSLENNRLQVEMNTTTDLLNAQMQWQQANANYISAKANVKINEAQCYKSIGELNP